MAFWTGEAPLILASASPARRLLLNGAGVHPETIVSKVDERAIEVGCIGLSPATLAERLATEKALAVSRHQPGRLVVGADQVLDLEGEVLHKPADFEEAAWHLARLAGRTHALRSAVALVHDETVIETVVESATLTMRPLSAEAIALYLEAVGDAALLGAGAYQVESLGIHLFEAIEGDHSTILGLPLIPLLGALRRRGCLAF